MMLDPNADWSNVVDESEVARDGGEAASVGGEVASNGSEVVRVANCPMWSFPVMSPATSLTTW